MSNGRKLWVAENESELRFQKFLLRIGISGRKRVNVNRIRPQIKRLIAISISVSHKYCRFKLKQYLLIRSTAVIIEN